MSFLVSPHKVVILIEHVDYGPSNRAALVELNESI